MRRPFGNRSEGRQVRSAQSFTIHDALAMGARRGESWSASVKGPGHAAMLLSNIYALVTGGFQSRAKENGAADQLKYFASLGTGKAPSMSLGPVFGAMLNSVVACIAAISGTEDAFAESWLDIGFAVRQRLLQLYGPDAISQYAQSAVYAAYDFRVRTAQNVVSLPGQGGPPQLPHLGAPGVGGLHQAHDPTDTKSSDARATAATVGGAVGGTAGALLGSELGPLGAVVGEQLGQKAGEYAVPYVTDKLGVTQPNTGGNTSSAKPSNAIRQPNLPGTDNLGTQPNPAPYPPLDINEDPGIGSGTVR